MVRPLIVMIFPVPFALLANTPVADDVDSVTASAPMTPARAADPLMRREVAAVVPSYTLLLAVMPVTVRVFAVMFAVAVGWVSVYRPACAPASKVPVAVTVLPLPTVLVPKAPVEPALLMVTVSPLTTPFKVALVKSRVAVVDLSYSLLAPVMPEMVRAFAPTTNVCVTLVAAL